MWNCELSAAYWPSISLVEIAVRNAIDAQLCVHLGVSSDEGWYREVLADRPRIHLTDKERDKIKKVLDVFDRQNTAPGHPLREPTGGDVVSGLSLGFWVSLVGEGIPRQNQTYDYHRKLWRPFLHQAFPLYGPDGKNSPGAARGGLREFELLRNRVAHHEPIFNFNHRYHRNNIVTIAGWINTDLAQFIREQHQAILQPVIDRYRSYVVRPDSA